MNERENRDDLVKRIIKQKQEDQHRELSSKEKQDVEQYVAKKIMPQVYEDNK